jgi:hypothetical protein
MRSKSLDLSAQANVGFDAGPPHLVGHKPTLINVGNAAGCRNASGWSVAAAASPV